MPEHSWRWYLLGEKREKTCQRAADTNQPSNEPKITRAIDKTPAADPATADKKDNCKKNTFEDRQICAMWALNYITGFAALVALLGIAAVVYSVRETHQGNVDANRAWIAPMGMTVDGDIKGNSDLTLGAHYANIGKGPATKVRAGYGMFTAPIISPLLQIFTGDINACDVLPLEKQGIAIYPDTKDHWQFTTIARKLIPETITRGSEALGLRGCYAYQTMGELHRVWFCEIVYRDGKIASLASTDLCGDGQGAD
jgi:hypothetical protein